MNHKSFVRWRHQPTSYRFLVPGLQVFQQRPTLIGFFPLAFPIDRFSKRDGLYSV
jgi:hypothetical protein